MNQSYTADHIRDLKERFPLLNKMTDLEEVFWINPILKDAQYSFLQNDLTLNDVIEAKNRLERFAPFIASAFPETDPMGGIIESPIVPIDEMKAYLEETTIDNLIGRLLLKCDSRLPISGSIKARGGIYEVLKHAEDLAFENDLLHVEDNYGILTGDSFRKFFSNYSIAVGSTGNLGLSIGIIGAALGFKVFVHMSSDAKQWKKDLLRSKGVTVFEYASDYSKAVEEGRKLSDQDPNSYFIDDENSKHLFMGYAVAALRLKSQLEDMDIKVDEEHPLFVYLPCGVGGGPGGVTYGLKLIYGDHVHCFFSEPTHSPCMLIGCMTGLHDKICVQDLGIDNVTVADGLAVGRASGFVGKTLENLLSGIFTVQDQELFRLLYWMHELEGIRLEPSALAGIPGILHMCGSSEGKAYINKQNLVDKMYRATHIAWATGGDMVPEEEMNKYILKGKELI